ncbi:MAG: bifunctional 4-hydroxy-2-oxoglutarate aldolase/2-dehydro-3-deoxy-phosphogluconate aldolase [Prochlorococcus marinus CUG1439]|uniref:bifunctional 4-hydroxy-2-oxoglutarate aldolase/2-dehydro-3-deoxy-phosphogluconate aldolase n=1 Tax=Prochlorococcus sp. MIT 1314 TaxID=3096220 RepID=UPI001B167DCD|nr:bifunctional 4-hydroxy-2-oxoglutarate aldolase/2-dehydro-3-deoxy-phosphogluconate aldolase [Prochlorococcus sp. MIT 1314]MCR8539527.1 bifunctional 4-hydroxy-2-oxoglutarate aldolase/2-dehydro-3-deoxy-phosphogluconate aldolase [Prochlorococcus marinus CUG1439]
MNNKGDSFSELLKKESFFLLIKPEDNIYSSTSLRYSFFEQLESLVKSGLKNIEISWSNNENWLDFVSGIKLKYPRINLGSASIVNHQSIEDSLEIGLNFSMMKFWDKDLFNYAKSKNYLLIPGITNLKDLEEAINLNCKIIKIYPIKRKDNSIDILNFKNIDFIAAGGLSINDIKTYKSLGYKAIVIGDKGIKNKKFDPNIYEWLKNNKKN